MISSVFEPTTGLRVVHVIPSDWGPFVDIRASYQAFAVRNPWCSVITPREYGEVKKGWDQETIGDPWWDLRTAFVVWDLHAADPGPRKNRRALVTAVYSEALASDENKLLAPHRTMLSDFIFKAAPNLDGAFAHTPRMELLLDSMLPPTCKTGVLPVGWEVEAMGSPRWEAPKFHEMLVYGSVVGRREIVQPYLLGTLNDKDHELLKNVGGSYGRQLLSQLDNAHASLYVAHSDVDSYSTWRLWQIASTSACLLSEPGDTWPFVAEEHYLGIDKLTLDNAWNVSLQIKELLSRKASMLACAARAHDLAREYNLDMVNQKYLLPALANLAESRENG